MATSTKRKTVSPELWEDLDKYAAVSVCCTEQACDAARTLAGYRLLQEEAPKLPLGPCDAATCRCTYVAHRDRRNFLGNRRSVGDLAPAKAGNLREDNRRSGPDRRAIKVNFKSRGA